MNADLPFREIQDKGLRTHTAALVALLASGYDDDDVCQALIAASDPRSIGPLTALLLDTRQDDVIRHNAGWVLRNMEAHPGVSDEMLQQWWTGEDQVLKRHALLRAGPQCREIVLEVARDADHPWHNDALWRMTHYFPWPEEQALLIEGLSLPDPEDRTAAAATLIWEEPVAAEDRLLVATCDDSEVAVEACHTLAYYLSQRSFWRLAELRSHCDPDIASQACASFESLQDDFSRAACDDEVGERIQRWLKPVSELLDLDKARARKSAPCHPSPPFVKRRICLAELQRVIEDPDLSGGEVSWDFLHPIDWSTAPAAERGAIARMLLAAPDASLHFYGPYALAEWGEQRPLLQLLDHPEFLVRKTAMYQLGRTPPFTPAIARIVWRHFESVRHLGCHGYETLATWVAHAGADAAVPRLLDLALDQREVESIRLHAIWDLKPLSDAAEIQRLLPLLAEPPALTWALHTSLLQLIRDFQLPAPDVRHLHEVDRLEVQVELAELCSRSSP